MQDPPIVINEFIKSAKKGYDVIYGVRRKRKEIFYKKFAYGIFYKLLAALSKIEIPLDSGDFCLMTRKALTMLNDLPEHNRFIRGLSHILDLNKLE